MSQQLFVKSQERRCAANNPLLEDREAVYFIERGGDGVSVVAVSVVTPGTNSYLQAVAPHDGQEIWTVGQAGTILHRRP